MKSRAVKLLLWLAGIAVASAAIYLFVMFGPPGVAERISKPEFCASCHNMRPQFAAFERGQHSQLESCNDCHLPNTNPVRHYFWDGVLGLKDLVKFNLGAFPEQPTHIEATDLTRDFAEENCRRCHRKLVDHIDIAGRRCWDCHRDVYHRQTGLPRDVPSEELFFEWAKQER